MAGAHFWSHWDCCLRSSQGGQQNTQNRSLISWAHPQINTNNQPAAITFHQAHGFTARTNHAKMLERPLSLELEEPRLTVGFPSKQAAAETDSVFSSLAGGETH